MTRLLELEAGREARIERLEVDGEDGPLLRAMGLCEGEPVTILRRGLLGGPLHVRVGEASFALGRSLAEQVWVSDHAGSAS